MKKFTIFFIGLMFALISCGTDVNKSADINYGDAREILLTDIEKNPDRVQRVMGYPYLLSKDTSLESKKRAIDLPSDGYLFLVDPKPLIEWDHECVWLFLSASSGEIISYEMDSPPEVAIFDEMEEFYINLIGPIHENGQSSLTRSSVQKPYTQGKNNRYALLIAPGNQVRHWADTAQVYKMLKSKYYILPSRIDVCMFDGDSTSADMLVWYSNKNSSTDLDGDGLSDYSKNGSRSTIIAALDSLASKVRDGDTVFIYVTGIGGRSWIRGESFLNTWDNDKIYSGEFAEKIEALPDKTTKMIIMQQSFSGGFLNDLMDIRNLVMATAADEVSSSWAGTFGSLFNTFSYEWTGRMSAAYQSYDNIIDPDYLCQGEWFSSLCIDQYNDSLTNRPAGATGTENYISFYDAYSWAKTEDKKITADSPQFLDTDGIAESANLAYSSVVNTPDVTPPVAGNDGAITLTSTTGSKFQLNWESAEDNVTDNALLEYIVYISTENNIWSAELALENGSPLNSWSADINAFETSTLSYNTTYYFNVLVRDQSGNVSEYLSDSIAVNDLSAPDPENSGTIVTGAITGSSVTLNWAKAADNVSPESMLSYQVYRSESDNIRTVSDATANGTAVFNSWQLDIDSSTVDNLSEAVRYYFNVLVQDQYGNIAAYTSFDTVTLDI